MFLYRKISEYLEKTKYIKYFSKFMEMFPGDICINTFLFCKICDYLKKIK